MSVTKSSKLVFPKLLMLIATSLATACGDASEPLRPAAPKTDTTAAVSAPSPSPFGEPSRAATIYNGPDNLYSAYVATHGGLLASRYVFYEDSTFALQFSSARFGFFEYDGRYSNTNSEIKLSFFGWSTAGPWEASGALNGGELSVSYNTVMMLSDFVDGVYVRSR